MKVALAQINPIVGAFEKNASKIEAYVDRAKEKSADLVIFPELSLVGYPPLDLLDKDHFVEDNLKCLRHLATKIKGIAAVVGFIDKRKSTHGKPYHNAAALIANGKIISRHSKSLLPSYDVFDETRHFEPAPKIKTAKFKKQNLAISICEDVWNDKDYWQRRRYTKDPIATLYKKETPILINISASPFSLGKKSTRRDVLISIAKKYKTPVIFVNQVGGNDELIFDGASFVINKSGKVIGQCHDFRQDLIVVDLETGYGEKHSTTDSEIEAIHRALVLGIQDYVYKCGFKKALIGLSGGIDSAVTAALAVDALGSKNVIGIMMPSRYSSKSSLDDAQGLIKNLGIKSKIISIESIFSGYLKSLKPLMEKDKSDITEQNIQARIRGNILMAHSNQWNALVLSTGNKSEMATGYCTLYGDMSGGLSVLSDVPKTLVYKLAKYINKKQTLIPSNTITRAPSAELKYNQRDQDTLPPYGKLDQIISSYVEDHQSVSKMRQRGFVKSMLEDVVQRIDRNEYKRRQAPPGLRITHKAFGIGRRLPLAQQYKEFAD